jgi:hypothetical protein
MKFMASHLSVLIDAAKARRFSSSAHAKGIKQNSAEQRLRPAPSGFRLAAGCWLCLILAGCNGATSSSNSRSVPTDHSGAESCEKQLDGALSMLKPESLGISGDRDRAVDLLNTWIADCGSLIETAPEQSVGIPEMFQRQLPPESLQLLTAEGFVDRDGSHIRDCLLSKKAAEFALGDAGNDVDRVVNLFHYVVRNVQLTAGHPYDLPLTTHDVLMFGQGTASDRAWIFANLLKQLRIDAVVLQSSAHLGEDESARAEGPLWVGVLLDNEVYLFDPQLGSPIPSADDPGTDLTVTRPATLNEVVGDPSLLERLDVAADRPYPFRVEDLQQLRVLLVGDVSFWAPRMNRLQSALIGDRSVVVYDGLEDVSEVSGLLSRVVQAGSPHWQIDDVALWLYPEQQLETHEHMEDGQRQHYLELQRVFGMPTPIVDIEEGSLELTFGPPQRLHLKTRTQQLIGDYAGAIGEYLKIRAYELLPPISGGAAYIHTEAKPILRVKMPRELRELHEQAAHDSYYWMGVCQFEQDKFAMAIKSLTGYLDRFPRGRWTTSCRYLLAVAYSDNGDYAQAIEHLKRVPQDDPQYAGIQLLLKRAERLAAAK